MHLGIAIEETWSFFREIYDDLAAHHQVSAFERRRVGWPLFNDRINRYLFKRDLQAFLRDNDVVFFEWASALLAAASQLPKTAGIVTRLHRYELYQWADRVNWDAVDRIILVSRAKEREFLARFPRQAAKVAVIPEAVSLDRFRPHSRPFRGHIGTLCHLRPRKRVYELILAFAELVRRRGGFHLHIGGGRAAGFDEYYQALQVLVQKLGLQDRVTFHGNVTEPETWYANLDVFISNSYSEGLQVAPLEAIAAGCYCLSHQWDAADEFFPADNLYFTERELVEKVIAYAETLDDEKERLKNQLRLLVSRQCDVEQAKGEIRRLIEEVAAARRA